MKHKTKYYLLLVLVIISLLSSLALSFSPVSEVCQIGQISENGCDAVHNSPYNYTLGIQNSYFGVAIFLLLSFVLYKQIQNPTKRKEQYINAAIIIGSVIAIYFIALQIFVINDYCQYCLAVDISLLISLTIILFDIKNGRKNNSARS